MDNAKPLFVDNHFKRDIWSIYLILFAINDELILIKPDYNSDTNIYNRQLCLILRSIKQETFVNKKQERVMSKVTLN